MQVWEYLEVHVVFTEWQDSSGGKGTLRPGRPGLFIIQKLNELGAQGWELAGIASESDMEYRAFFKRPRE